MRRINPKTIAPPGSRYSHGVAHGARARRLVISGQVGMRADGSVAKTLREQAEVAFDNLLAIVAEGGMSAADLIKVTAFCTVPGSVKTFREARDRKLGGHQPASTYVEVAGLADTRFLFEIEGEAVSEEPDLLFEELPGEGAVLTPHGTPPKA